MPLSLPTRRRHLPVFALLAGCLLASAAMADETDDDHVAERDGLRVVHAWSRATEGPDGVVFLEIENEGAADTLTGAATKVALDIVIEGLRLEAGNLVGEPLGDVAIPAGGTFHFEPNVAQLRLVGLAHPLDEGDDYAIELVFGERGSITVQVEVEAATASQHSHAGHSH
jgi:copper(I)-binding protein